VSTHLDLTAEHRKLELALERMAMARWRYQRVQRTAFEAAEKARRRGSRLRTSATAVRRAMADLASAEATYIAELERVRELEARDGR
jgi:hypothetical protein